jgi:hypothetical protein
MEEQLTEGMLNMLKKVETLLKEGRYSELSSENSQSSLSTEEIENAILDYGGQITPAPESYFNQLTAIKIKGSQVAMWHIDYDLWINGERSDLTVSLRLVSSTNNDFGIILTNIHIL